MGGKAMRKWHRDRAYYGIDSGGGETEMSFHDVMGIRQP